MSCTLSSGKGLKNVTVCFNCRKCTTRYERAATAAEKRVFEKYRADDFPKKDKPENDVHRVYHEFCKKFYKFHKTGESEFLGKMFPQGESKPRWTGYALDQRVEKWAEKYPDDVRMVRVDDDYFSSSSLVLIEHKTKKKYMGTTVVFIPQCAPDPIATFFLYPSHRRGLVEALAAIEGQAKPIQLAERTHQKAASEAAKKVVKLPDSHFQPLPLTPKP
jgi:hypothetical protein